MKREIEPLGKPLIFGLQSYGKNGRMLKFGRLQNCWMTYLLIRNSII
jgi:hypothetical protein